MRRGGEDDLGQSWGVVMLCADMENRVSGFRDMAWLEHWLWTLEPEMFVGIRWEYGSESRDQESGWV